MAVEIHWWMLPVNDLGIAEERWVFMLDLICTDGTPDGNALRGEGRG